MRIQHAWRRWLIRRLLRRLARKDFRRVLDPVSRSYCYWLPNGDYLRREPYIMGSERWEIHNMILWGTDEVKLFLRRLKLKQHLKGAGPSSRPPHPASCL
jgi:hypothetical protein